MKPRSRMFPSGLFDPPRKRFSRAIAESKGPHTLDDRLAVAALLELARSKHHLARAQTREPKPRGKTPIGHDSVLALVDKARAELGAAALMQSPTGPILARASSRLFALERAGSITAAESARAFERILDSLSHTEVKGMSTNQTDTPPELASYSDGVSDDGAFHPEIIGCGLSGISGSIQHLSVAGTGGIQHLSVAGSLGDLAVAGIPSYLLSRRNLSNPEVRRRVASAIERMTPKMKRRVLRRLRTAVSVARVSGQVRGAYPSIAGTASSPGVGWSGVMVSGRGSCPYANVAGALTP